MVRKLSTSLLNLEGVTRYTKEDETQIRLEGEQLYDTLVRGLDK